MTRHLAIFLAFISPMLAPLSVQADSAPKEINHLIQFVSTSGCTFIRNGNEHSSLEAVEHMKKKYQYFSSKIDSAEAFIELSASKSTFSGQPYHIKCENQPKEKSQSWLLNELTRYRKAEKLEVNNT